MAFSLLLCALIVLMVGGSGSGVGKKTKRGLRKVPPSESSSAAVNPSVYQALYDDTPGRSGSNQFNRPAGLYRTDEAMSKHKSLFIHCTVIGERSIKLDDFPNTLISRVIRSRNWESLTSYVVHPNISIVKEFYANIDPYFVDSNYLHCFVRTRFFHITPQTISTFFNVPVVRNPQFPYTSDNSPSLNTVASLLTGGEREWNGIASTLRHSELTQEFAILHVFVSANIFPVFHTTHVNKDKAKIMYALATNATFDLGSFVFRMIVSAFENSKKNSSLPFGSLITSLCRRAQVPDNANDIFGSLGATYNLASLNKRLKVNNRVRPANPDVGANFIPGENADIPPVPPPEENPYSMEAMWDLMARMDGKMDSLHGRFDVLQQTVDNNYRSTTERLDALDGRLAFYHNIYNTGGWNQGGEDDEDEDDDGNDDDASDDGMN